MKETDLYKAFGSTPESVKRRVSCALHPSAKEDRMKKKAATGLILTLMLMLITGVVYAVANHSWLAEIFANLYSHDPKTVSELENQTPATLNRTYELGELIITLQEAAVLPDGRMFATVHVALRKGVPGVLINDLALPDDPAYVNFNDAALQKPGLDRREIPTYAELAKIRGEKLIHSKVWVQVEGADTGYSVVENEDESYILAMENAAVSPENGIVHAKLGAILYEMTLAGDEVEGTRVREDWTLDIPVTTGASGN